VLDRASAAEFSPLVQRTLVDGHGERLIERLARGHLAEMRLVDPAAAASTVERARRGDIDVLREVVTLAALEVWLDQLRAPADRAGIEYLYK
jgi:hypothetical protein